MGILLPNSSINRKVGKAPFADLTGVQRIAKTGWLSCQDGVTRKIFNSAVPLTFYQILAYAMNGHGTATATNNTTSSNIALAGLVSTSNNADQGEFRIWFKLPYTSFSSGQQLLQINGTTTLGGASGGYQVLVQSSSMVYASYSGTGAAAGTYTDNAAISAKYAAGGETIYLVIDLVGAAIGSNSSTSTSISMPWDKFTWLPTGDKFELAT